MYFSFLYTVVFLFVFFSLYESDVDSSVASWQTVDYQENLLDQF